MAPQDRDGYLSVKIGNGVYWVKTDDHKQLQVTNKPADATHFRLVYNKEDGNKKEQDRIWDKDKNIHVVAHRPIPDVEPVVGHDRTDDFQNWNFEWRTFDGNHQAAKGTIRAVWSLDHVWTVSGSLLNLAKIQGNGAETQIFELSRNKPH